MTKVVIYPNNSVEVDGRSFHWPNEEFERYGIPKVRIVRGKAGSAEHRRVDGVHLVIFPTKEIGGDRNTARANADQLLKFCEICGKPCRVKYCLQHAREIDLKREALAAKKKKSITAFTRRRRTKRKYYHDKFGRLFLECTNCEDMKVEDDFHRHRGLRFGRYGSCKKCWNAYSTARRKKDAKGGTQTVHQDPPQHRP